ncbi:Splicing factor 3B subunit 4 [Apophysomyces ossiformis]|uniref:Splicing factor 3B subunit 4 n=1 Tax=Apophysomyces ossiformis TaxID=679940 RepID=A0A8H7BWC6_9FUNG|nr:Splicing factor 3B subunit 4 [Apophysomyces ossiformis]
MAQQIERNQEATVYVGNLDERCTDSLVWELMLQAGPVVNVHLPKDRVTQSHQGYGFCEFLTEEDADYAIKIMNQVRLFGKPIRVNKATSDKKNLDVGATLFIGNLDPDVDEKLLYDTFSAFGLIVQTPNIARDPETGNFRGFGFVSYDNFESSDAAIDAMNGQYLMNKQITVSYAYKKDGKGERHGSAAERLLAAEARKHVQMPNRLFATGGTPMMPVAPYPTAAYPAQPMMTPAYSGVTPAGVNGYRPPPPPPPMMGAAGGAYARPPMGGYPPYGAPSWQ